MEIPNAETDDGMTAGMSYVLREEGQLAQVWGEGDRAEHERNLRDTIDRLGGIRQLVEGAASSSRAYAPGPIRFGSGSSP